ncbi:phosphoenolpyruvate--protein phosphotransferase [Panacagrimonas perspica]|uniref:Phosphoenolpyruvate-protein phosphotransferase n=1 Tax=Panacagrimonas perspica TaxID=381431 RepID=A0A4R7PBJ5_9GAMM|nr:phosphoenolpyruvate--protein phosphotransferase [Panacagrimonas perspica]TDU30841.1 phosphoenolpyruvate--protein phosphotransferase [Panacagrimonas perspica]THD01652.1 phosphoenolpyruvate--protein phosphotransferase [Panacagrimonas perspica]
MSLWLSGIGVSRGIAIARVQKLHGGDLEIAEYTVAPEELEREIERFRDAQQQALAQLREVRSKIPAGTPGDIAAFIDTHLLMLDDRSLVDSTVANIRSAGINAEAALRRSRDALVAVFEQMEDPYLRTRRDDVEHVVSRVQRVLTRTERELPGGQVPLTEPTVIVADDITPADIILLSQQAVLAFVTEYGGPLSHTAILARSLGIPAVVGLHNARRLLRENELVIVDGEHGHVLADPDDKALEHYRRKQDQQAQDRRLLQTLRDKPAISGDGVEVRLQANIELPEDAAVATANGAAGIGLYRTEFLYMNRKGLPTEEEQYQAYSRVVSAVRGPITIRTLDLGADKQVDSGQRQGPTPNNPALGLRAIRLCLKEPELFRVQMRALLRASAHGQVRIMLPMISSLSELRQAKALMATCRAELIREGRVVADRIPVGAMIEVPAAAISSSLLAREVDFFSIGTNDLIQYTLAIDRVDDEVNYLYDPLHPAVLRLIHMTIEAGHKAGIEVSMCGEMAGDACYTRLLLGLGLTDFSMHPANVLEVKRAVREAQVGELRRRVADIMQAASLDDFASLLAAL